MEKFSDALIYAIEEGQPDLKLNRPQDQQYQGAVIDALKNYFAKNPQKIDRVFAIGNNKMMHEIVKLRREKTVKEIAEAPIAITSLNAPMQCMLKGICSQCLQKKTNDRGETEFFYACVNQDQNTDQLDFQHLHYRCEQNSLAEKISRLWIENLQPKG